MITRWEDTLKDFGKKSYSDILATVRSSPFRPISESSGTVPVDNINSRNGDNHDYTTTAVL